MINDCRCNYSGRRWATGRQKSDWWAVAINHSHNVTPFSFFCYRHPWLIYRKEKGWPTWFLVDKCLSLTSVLFLIPFLIFLLPSSLINWPLFLFFRLIIYLYFLSWQQLKSSDHAKNYNSFADGNSHFWCVYYHSWSRESIWWIEKHFLRCHEKRIKIPECYIVRILAVKVMWKVKWA